MGCGRVRQQPPTGCLHGWHWSTYGCHEGLGAELEEWEAGAGTEVEGGGEQLEPGG